MKGSELKIATNIKTSIFYSITEFLKMNDWNVTAEYDENIFDKAIDFDFYEFDKGDDKIRLAWNNWFEGEIEARPEILNKIARHFRVALDYKQPEYLHRTDIIENMKGLIKRRS